MDHSLYHVHTFTYYIIMKSFQCYLREYFTVTVSDEGIRKQVCKRGVFVNF